MIKVVIPIEAPRPHVFSVFTDYARYKEWLPGCEQSNVLSRSGSATDVEIVFKMMKTVKLGLRFDAQADRSLDFRMTTGTDLKAYAGSYRLMDSPEGNATVVIAELEIDAGPFAPKFMVNRMAKSALEDSGRALRKHIPTVPYRAEAPAAAVPVAAAARQRRPKRILHVARTPLGYRVWFNGQTFNVKS